MTSPRSTTDMDKIIGTNIVIIRKRNGDTQKSLGDKLRLSFQQVQKYEGALNRIPASRLFQIANLYGLKVDDFFTPMKTKIVKANNG